MVLICLFVIILISSIRHNFNYDNYLSKSTAKPVKGVMAMLVLMGHSWNPEIAADYNSVYMVITRMVIGGGYLAVAAFYFFSGYGLTLQYESGAKKSIVFRIIRLWLIYAVINLFYCIVYALIGIKTFSVKEMFLSFFLPVINKNAWYLFSIAFFYLLTHVSYSICKGNRKVISIMMVVGTMFYIVVCRGVNMGSWWFVSCSGYFIGTMVSQHYKRLCEILKSKRFVSIIPVTLFFIIYMAMSVYTLEGKWYTAACMISSTLFVCCLLVFLYNFQFRSKVLIFLGEYSLEIYLVNLFVYTISRFLYIHQLINAELASGLVILGTVFWAVLLKKTILRLIPNKINGKTYHK